MAQADSPNPHRPGRVRKPRNRSTRHRPTDDELLDAACAVIADVGSDRSTMDMIADRAGTSRVTLYAHFGSRESLVSRLIGRELDNFTTWMSSVYEHTDDMPYGARARRIVEALFDYARRHPDGLRVILGHRDNTDRRLYAALEPKIAARLRTNYAQQGVEIGAGADTLASLLLVMSLDVAHRALFVDGADIDAACDLTVTATQAVLREVRPAQLTAIDRSVPGSGPASDI
ncbi:TetR/AcrR family transcriptional regulator [Gordonia sp. ABSL1-1]|uniref:TetR/AcrR family transcriptional regulator n=1 Tax=Gordonia sp. ABSL1-1 TaxID=3053923 RepID=UPI0025729FD2|nr:TetR/AcrR family transcriptional regulator [Gordonia sp. ABSL1-1]MDL9938377.1 TetR/AcrR family transcriptional regulator [Gordonia sp. ABSL1-1]